MPSYSLSSDILVPCSSPSFAAPCYPSLSFEVLSRLSLFMTLTPHPSSFTPHSLSIHQPCSLCSAPEPFSGIAVIFSISSPLLSFRFRWSVYLPSFLLRCTRSSVSDIYGPHLENNAVSSFEFGLFPPRTISSWRTTICHDGPDLQHT